MSGVETTFEQGDVGHGGISIVLSGQVISCGQGEFSPRHGEVAFFAQGTLIPSVSMAPLTGQAISTAQGTVTAEITGGGGVTVHLSGVEAAFFQDSVVIGPTQLTGSATTSESGSVTPSWVAALTGSAITSQSGTITANQEAEDTYIASASGAASPSLDLPLTGQEITGAQGTFSVSAQDKTAAISGAGDVIRILSEQGTATPNITMVLVGQVATLAQENVGAPGGAALTGASVTVQQGFLGRAFPISGQEITSAQGTIVGLPGIVALVGQSMTAETGTLRVTGTNWTEESEPTTTWTLTSNPDSSWTRKGSSSTTWNRK